MEAVREFCGYLLALAFVVASVAMCGIAWLGLSDEFGWRVALLAVAASAAIRVNFPLLVGLYLFAFHSWGWSSFQSLAFAAPGLLLLMPSIASEVFAILMGSPTRR